MNEIMNISGIECYEKDGVVYLKLETVARGLGFTRIAASGNEVVRWETVRKYLSELGVPTSWHGDSPPVGKEGLPDFIPENIFYRLAMKAKNEVAERFQALVADEVIPSIRKHGAYMTSATIEKILTDPDPIIHLATELKEERAKRKSLEAENEQQRQIIADFEPIKHYVDTILESPGAMATSQIAADYDMSTRRLNKILHEEGIQHCVNGQWILYRKYMGQGYTKSKTFTFDRSDGRPDAKTQTYWTQKGRLWLNEVLNKRGIYAIMDRPSAS